MTEETKEDIFGNIDIVLTDIEIDAQDIIDSVIEIEELLEKIKGRV